MKRRIAGTSDEEKIRRPEERRWWPGGRRWRISVVFLLAAFSLALGLHLTKPSLLEKVALAVQDEKYRIVKVFNRA